ncbi:MAG: hypothetical protein ACREH4_04565 [Vitreimonas sp.]
MAKPTCAACDCELDENTVQVKIGGQTVEVCCDECAIRLREAQVTTQPAQHFSVEK